MGLKTVAATVVAVALAGSAFAQHHHHRQSHETSLYAGLAKREVKALSDENIADLKNGRGMGMALAAELNGYPGPMHVLELSDALQLTSEQHRRFRQLFESMKAEAIAEGEKLIGRERDLDRQFAEQRISPEALSTLTAEIGEIQGRLRAIHLKYHLSSADLLSSEQRRRYSTLRGYH